MLLTELYPIDNWIKYLDERLLVQLVPNYQDIFQLMKDGLGLEKSGIDPRMILFEAWK